MDFLFDKDGRLCVIRNSKDGTEEPKTIFCIDNSGTVISGLDVDPEDGRGNEFDDEGRLLYTGFHKNGLREGQGTSFYPDGRVEFTGQWKNGVCRRRLLWPERRGTLQSGRSELIRSINI